MHKAALALVITTTAIALAQEPVVDRSTIWIDKVKRGDMQVMVRGEGVLSTARTAELQVPISLARRVTPGLAASIDIRRDVVQGKVARVGSNAVDGKVPVIVDLDATASSTVGTAVDGAIRITTLSDVTYVGRPLAGTPDSDGDLFMIEPDGRHARRIKVRYGQSSVNTMEIRSGLQPGDQVILSDMSAHKTQERVRLQ
jgi:hypothetical protein